MLNLFKRPFLLKTQLMRFLIPKKLSTINLLNAPSHTTDTSIYPHFFILQNTRGSGTMFIMEVNIIMEVTVSPPRGLTAFESMQPSALLCEFLHVRCCRWSIPWLILTPLDVNSLPSVSGLPMRLLIGTQGCFTVVAPGPLFIKPPKGGDYYYV